MKKVSIKSIGINENKNLFVIPAEGTFDYIYRAAKTVRWDKKTKHLFVFEPDNTSSVTCLRIIKQAVEDEYNTELTINSKTDWSNTPKNMRESIMIYEQSGTLTDYEKS